MGSRRRGRCPHALPHSFSRALQTAVSAAWVGAATRLRVRIPNRIHENRPPPNLAKKLGTSADLFGTLLIKSYLYLSVASGVGHSNAKVLQGKIYLQLRGPHFSQTTREDSVFGWHCFGAS